MTPPKPFEPPPDAPPLLPLGLGPLALACGPFLSWAPSCGALSSTCAILFGWRTWFVSFFFLWC